MLGENTLESTARLGRFPKGVYIQSRVGRVTTPITGTFKKRPQWMKQ